MHPASRCKLGLKTLHQGSSSNKASGPLLDLVAVHGLGANPDRTWTTNGVNWLQDPEMLPSAIPWARIMRFGYESAWLGRDAIQQRLPIVAEKLLHSLRMWRLDCTCRPIVLVGHCFGGIVIEKAVLTAKLHEEEYPGVFKSISGVVFLGTPQRGTDSQSKASVISSIAAAVGLGKKSRILDIMARDSECLSDLVHDFTRAIITANIDVSCFFEQHASDVSKIIIPKLFRWISYKKIMVEEHSATLDGFVKLALACDHFQMHRYESATDSNYQCVKGELVRVADAAVDRLHEQKIYELATDNTIGKNAVTDMDERDKACLEALFVTDPRDDMRTIEVKKDKALDHSGEWIIGDTAFRHWMAYGGSSALWLHGDPGKGKTMLAIALVEELPKSLNPNDCLSYFFCDNKDDRRRSAENILRGLLYQVFISRPELVVYFRREYERQKEHLLRSPTTLFTLWRILEDIMSSPQMGRLYVVVDALDECDLESIDNILSLLEPFVDNGLGKDSKPAGTPPRYSNAEMKFIITSRNELAIKERLNSGLHISLEKNHTHVSHLVRRFVDAKVQQLKKVKQYNDELAADVNRTLLDKAEGTFLWAALACRELAKPSVRLATTRPVLEKLPSGIKPLYDRIVDQILNTSDEDMAHRAKMILKCMAVARRPLALRELVVIASLPADYSDETAILEDLVLGYCGSMTDVRDGVVYFVHLSARDYIASSPLLVPDGLSSCHYQVARTTFDYLRGCRFAEDFSREPSVVHTEGCDRLEYPVLFWMHHAKLSARFSSKYLLENKDFFEQDSSAFRGWFCDFWGKSHAKWEKRPSEFGLLHLAAYSNLSSLIELLCETDGTVSVNVLDSEGNTPLMWAAKMGSLESVRELLQNRSADMSVKNKNGVTALFLAAAFGHDQVVGHLAERGASVHITDKLGWTPLHRAADQGNATIVALLLQHNAKFEAKDDSTWTPLYRAVSGGYVDIIKIFMKHNANLEMRDREGMTLLQTAAWNGHEKAVGLLLMHGAEVEASDREGWTSLHHASWNGHAAVVQLLLEKGADAGSKNHEGNTSLYHATWNGHLEVVRLLLQGKANANETCADGETALQQAAWRGHDAVAMMLIEAGADLNIRSRTGRSALHDAATNGQQTMVDLLLRAGADPSVTTEDGQTAFESAKENSYYDVARYLEKYRCIVDGEQLEEGVEPCGVDEENMGVDVDPAIADVLGLAPSHCTMREHGDACSSEPFRITAVVNGKEKYYFTKTSPESDMFEGEHTSLTTLYDAVPLICPRSIAHGKLTNSDRYFLLTEFLDVNPRANNPGSGLSFAQKLAALHQKATPVPEGETKPMFGFPIMTYAGRTKQDNTFRHSWAEFYAEKRLLAILTTIEETHGSDEELREWTEKTASVVVPNLLRDGHLGGENGIKPSLVHGDLWSGNKARGRVGGKGGIEEVAFDPSCCYAHSEYELGLMRMFGGFSAGFFSEYHLLVPKTEPTYEYEDRMTLYQIYHWLNNWLLFRGGYRDDAIGCMHELYSKYGS